MTTLKMKKLPQILITSMLLLLSSCLCFAQDNMPPAPADGNSLSFRPEAAGRGFFALAQTHATLSTQTPWIDLNHDGVYQDGEECKQFNTVNEFTFATDQIYTIYGDIRSFYYYSKFDDPSVSITELDVTNLPNLDYLSCNHTKVSKLLLQNCPKLEHVVFTNAKLNVIDLSNNPRLIFLALYGNQLKELDIRSCTRLSVLYFYGNQIKTIDTSNNTNLSTIIANDNQLSAFDLSSNDQLREFECADNQLEEIDLSHNPILERIRVQGNKLKSLQIAGKEKLKDLRIYQNQFSAEEMQQVVDQLPVVEVDPQTDERGTFYHYHTTSETEGNFCSPEQVAIAEAKNWFVLNQDGNNFPGVTAMQGSLSTEYPIVQIHKGSLQLDNLTTGSTIRIYTIEGNLVQQSQAKESSATIPLVAGTYILQTSQQIQKILIP